MNHLSEARGARMLHALALLLAGWSTSGPAQASEGGGVLSLEFAMEQAVAEAPQLTAARAHIDAARHSLRGAGRLPDPEVVVGLANLPVTTAERFSLSQEPMTMREVGVTQGVPSRARRRADAEVAVQGVVSAQAQLKAREFEVQRLAAQSWVDSAVAAQSLDRLRVLRGDLLVVIESARAAFVSGRDTAVSVLSGESELAGLDSRILQFEKVEATSRAALARWIGDDAYRRLGQIPWRALSMEPLPAHESGAAWHPELEQDASAVALARAQVESARATKKPDWSAALMYGERSGGRSDMISLQFRVALPLFSRYRQDPVIAASLAEARASEADRASSERKHRAELQGVIAQWQTGQSRLRHFEDVLLPLVRDRTRMLVASYGAGQGDLRSVIQAIGEEADYQIEFAELAGQVAGAGIYLRLLQVGGGAP